MPPRIGVRKDCIDRQILDPVLLDYFDANAPDTLVGQTAAINFALIPLLYDKTGIHFNLNIGWMVRDGKVILQHDEWLIRRFLKDGREAWLGEGCPFHLWLTSPACEIVDVTYAMNLGCAQTWEQCSELIVYQSAYAPAGDLVYHPMLVGPDFFVKTGGVL